MVGTAPKPARFEETQRLGRNRLVRAIMVIEPVFLGLIFLVLGLGPARSSWPTLLAAWVAIALVMPLVVARLTMRTLVTDDELLVRWTRLFRLRIGLSEVETAEPVRYNPIADAGGGVSSSAASTGGSTTSSATGAWRSSRGRNARSLAHNAQKNSLKPSCGARSNRILSGRAAPRRSRP